MKNNDIPFSDALLSYKIKQIHMNDLYRGKMSPYFGFWDQRQSAKRKPDSRQRQGALAEIANRVRNNTHAYHQKEALRHRKKDDEKFYYHQHVARMYHPTHRNTTSQRLQSIDAVLRHKKAGGSFVPFDR